MERVKKKLITLLQKCVPSCFQYRHPVLFWRFKDLKYEKAFRRYFLSQQSHPKQLIYS